MAIPLTKEQQQALDTAGATPPQVVDPRTSAAYVLIPAEDYEAVREALVEERRQKAIRKIALRNAAGRMQEAP
jgi:PHD/YefM family antitoxin component YafN of YafNO toxin-antitoxin module